MVKKLISEQILEHWNKSRDVRSHVFSRPTPSCQNANGAQQRTDRQTDRQTDSAASEQLSAVIAPVRDSQSLTTTALTDAHTHKTAKCYLFFYLLNREDCSTCTYYHSWASSRVISHQEYTDRQTDGHIHSHNSSTMTADKLQLSHI